MAHKKDKLTKLEKYLLSIEWRDLYINGTLTNYQVSSDGHVRNKNTGKTLKGSPDKRGYLTASIWINKQIHTMLIHRLIAQTFIPNPDNKPTVNHKDGNKQNNAVSNLEWATHQENIDHAIQTGLRNLQGINAVSNIYTEAQVHEVCKLLEAGKNPKEIAKLLSVSQNLPRRIKYRGKWSHISKLYNIPKPEHPHIGINKQVIELLNNGIEDYDGIISILHLRNTNATRRYLCGIKVNYNKTHKS